MLSKVLIILFISFDCHTTPRLPSRRPHRFLLSYPYSLFKKATYVYCRRRMSSSGNAKLPAKRNNVYCAVAATRPGSQKAQLLSVSVTHGLARKQLQVEPHGEQYQVKIVDAVASRAAWGAISREDRGCSFVCVTGGCVGREKQCNGVADCLDGSDEKDCIYPDNDCSCTGSGSCTGAGSGNGNGSCSGPGSCSGANSGRGNNSCSGAGSCSGRGSGRTDGSCTVAGSCSGSED